MGKQKELREERKQLRMILERLIALKEMKNSGDPIQIEYHNKHKQGAWDDAKHILDYWS